MSWQFCASASVCAKSLFHDLAMAGNVEEYSPRRVDRLGNANALEMEPKEREVPLEEGPKAIPAPHRYPNAQDRIGSTATEERGIVSLFVLAVVSIRRVEGSLFGLAK